MLAWAYAVTEEKLFRPRGCPEFRVCLQRSKPEEYSADEPHGEITVGSFIISCSNGAELLESVNEPFDPIPHLIGFTVKGAASFVIALPRDGHMDAMLCQIIPDPLGAETLVSHEAIGTYPWPPAVEPPDRPVFHKVKELGRVMSLAWSEGECYRLAFSFCPEVDLGREPTSTTAKSLSMLPPFFAPAACWWALIIVVSTKWIVQST